jgi:hypothetical protein
MSSKVCKPLKRAKSTVGVPLSNDTLLPLESVALMLSTGTVNETTLAIGASVPTTNDGPVCVAAVIGKVPFIPLVQPATTSAAAVRHTSAIGKDFKCVLEPISVSPLCVCFFRWIRCEQQAAGHLGRSTRNSRGAI